MATPSSLSIVVPLYNEQKRLAKLGRGLEEFVRLETLPFSRIQIILVDDGSDDGTFAGFSQLKEEVEAAAVVPLNVIVRRNPENRGKGHAIQTGVALSDGDWVLTMDADLSTPPAAILRWLHEGYATLDSADRCYIGSRQHLKSQVTDVRLRHVMGRVFNLLVQMATPLTVDDSQCGFKLYPGETIRSVFAQLQIDGWGHDVEILCRLQRRGVTLQECPIRWQADPETHVKPARDSIRMFGELLLVRWIFFKDQFRWQNPGAGWNRATLGACLATLAVIFGTFCDYGMSWDEPAQHFYGSHIANFFGTLFKDRSALSYADLYLYGGFYEFIVRVIAKIFGEFTGWFTVYEVRHLVTAVLGLFAALGAGNLAKTLSGSDRARFFTVAFLILNPVFYGHTFMNTKDIPFAAFYIWAIYYIVEVLKHAPNFSRGLTAKLGIAIGMTMGVRVGGLILWLYLALFVGGYFAFLAVKRRYSVVDLLKAGLRIGLPVALTSYALMIVFWPWALMNPLVHPLQALKHMTHFNLYTAIKVAGGAVQSGDLPWSYVAHLMAIQNPEPLVVIMGICILLAGYRWFQKDRVATVDRVTWTLLVFSALFPLAYLVFQKSVLYDNYRHVLFVVPPLVVIAGLGFDRLLTILESARYRSTALVLSAAVALGFGPTVYRMIELHPYQYVYYNQFAGGIRQALQNYENDYWGTSTLDLMQTLEKKLAGDGASYKIFAYKPNYQVQLFAAASSKFTFTHEIDEADFVLAITRSRPGTLTREYFAQIRRFGANFAFVEDRRSRPVY